jgi:hypothetical protein
MQYYVGGIQMDLYQISEELKIGAKEWLNMHKIAMPVNNLTGDEQNKIIRQLLDELDGWICPYANKQVEMLPVEAYANKVDFRHYFDDYGCENFEIADKSGKVKLCVTRGKETICYSVEYKEEKRIMTISHHLSYDSLGMLYWIGPKLIDPIFHGVTYYFTEKKITGVAHGTTITAGDKRRAISELKKSIKFAKRVSSKMIKK